MVVVTDHDQPAQTTHDADNDARSAIPTTVSLDNLFHPQDVSEEFIYSGEDAELKDQDELWPTTGGTASDPEAGGHNGERATAFTGRKKKVRWELGEGHKDDVVQPIVAVPRRRRSRSLSGDELFNFRTPLNRSIGRTGRIADQKRHVPAPVVLPHLPMLEDGWQTEPYSMESGIPIIIQRPAPDDLQRVLDEDGPGHGVVLTASPRSIRTLSGSEDGLALEDIPTHEGPIHQRLSPGDIPTHEGPIHQRLSPGDIPMHEGPIHQRLSPGDIPMHEGLAPVPMHEGLAPVPMHERLAPGDIPTAPSSPSFPPLPTPAPSAFMMPKFTPPNFVQSPKPAMTRTVSRDRSIDITSPRSGIHFDKPLSDNNSTMYKQSAPASRLLSRQPSHNQRSSFNRRSLQAGPSSFTTTKPSPPNVTFLTSSPRSPLVHTLSPRTPQSTILSPAPLASIASIDDSASADLIVPRPESPPWKTVGSSVNLTSPRMKGTPSTSWRTEVINNSSILIKSPPVTPFTSVHLRIDELPNETDSDHESIHPAMATTTLDSSMAPPTSTPALASAALGTLAPASQPTLIAPITPDSSINISISPRPQILSPSPPRRRRGVEITPPPTPPLNLDEPPLSLEAIDEALAGAFMPWPTKEKEAAGILPVRKVVKRAERGEWVEGVDVDSVPRESALWRLIRAQRLWIQGHLELFKLKHPSGLPRDHKSPKILYVDSGEPLKAIEILVQSILLDPRVVAFKSAEARKDFTEQLAWQIYADSRFTDWSELSTGDAKLDDIFAEAETRAHGRGVISTRRALASFIRNHVVTAILEEQEGYTQLAIQKYGRALDTIDWVNASLGAGPDRKLYGRGDAKQRVEVVYEGVFARGVQIRLGHTLIAQYTYVKRDSRYSLLRNDLLAELLQGSINLFESTSNLLMSPYTHKDLKLDVYVSDYVYHIANAFFFQGFYARENGKIILDMGHSSPRGGRSAAEVAKERSASSAQAFVQAGLLFPEDEEMRIECFEMALEEILKVGGIRVGEALAMHNDLQKARATTDALWNRRAVVDDDEEGEDATAGLFDDDGTVAAKKKKKKKKKKKEAGDAAASATVVPEPKPEPKPEVKSTTTPNALAVPTPLPPAVPSETVDPAVPNPEQSPWRSPLQSFRIALIDSWLGALRRSQEEKRIMGGDVLHPAKNLRGRPEVVWKDVFDDGEAGGDDDDVGNVPWASWGMKSVKATKWEDLMNEEGVAKRSKKKTTKGQASASSSKPLAKLPPLPPPPPPIPIPTIQSPPKALTMTPGRLRRSFERASLEQVIAEVLSTPSLKAQHGGAYITAEGETSPEKAKPAGKAWERPTPWSMVQRISKQKLFAIDMDAFDGEGARS